MAACKYFSNPDPRPPPVNSCMIRQNHWRGAGLAVLSSPPALAYARAMEPEPDDFALMERYRAGDLAAFEELYRRHKDPLYRYLLRLGYRRDTADDVFQEVWGKIIKARDSYRPTALFRTFLFRIAHNCFVDHLRRNRRHDYASVADPDQQETGDAGPEAHAERELLRRRLEQALGELPQDQRDAWLLYEEGGLSPEQIAEVTGVNRETAKSRIRYATKKLRDRLGESGQAAAAGAAAGRALGKVSTP